MRVWSLPAREAEVGKLHVSLAVHEHVLGLQVPVDLGRENETAQGQEREKERKRKKGEKTERERLKK